MDLEYELCYRAKLKGVYAINLFACDRFPLPEQEGLFKKFFRGGTDAIQDPG